MNIFNNALVVRAVSNRDEFYCIKVNNTNTENEHINMFYLIQLYNVRFKECSFS